MGFFRPTVLLPKVIVDGKSAVELEPIITHELIHIRRGDLWVGVLQVLAQALWWFHPLVWLANRWTTETTERCCDLEVLSESKVSPANYARSLVDVLELKQSLASVPAFPGMRPVDITTDRLERIMVLGKGCRAPGVWRRRLFLLVMATTVLPGGAFVASAEERSSSEKTTSQRDNRVVTRVYPAKRALEKICDTMNCTIEQAMRQLQAHVVGDTGDVHQVVKSEWFGDELIVKQSISAHQRTAQRLKSVRQSGLVVVADKNYREYRPQDISVMGPVTSGKVVEALPPPSDDEVMKVLADPIKGGPPVVHETTLNNVRIVKEKIADYIDPRRFYPMIGKAQMHHAHYKCTVYADKTTKVGWPVPHTTEEKQTVEVLYIDHNHLHVFREDEESVKPEPVEPKGTVLPSPYYLQDDVQYFPIDPQAKTQP